MKAHNRKIVYLAAFLFSVALALTSYVNSSFLENFVNKYYVSATYMLASALTVLALLQMPHILNRLGNRKTSVLFFSLMTLALLGLVLGKSASVIIPSFILYFLAGNFIFASLDIFIEDFSSRGATGSIRGLYLLSISLAWVVSQLVSGSIIAKSSWGGIYIFAALFCVLSAVVIFIFLKNFKDPKYRKVPIRETLNTFMRDKNISKAYLANFILKFFYAWMIIYTPLYLHEYMGFEWGQIGIIFSIMLMPFVILDYPIGRISDKIGEKKILIFGFFTSAVFTCLIPFITEPNLLVWAGVLFMTRVGAASIEVMSESYFFKIVSERDDDEISFFRNTTPLSYTIAPLLAIPIFALTPSFQYIFYILSAILLCGALISLRLKDIR